MIRGFLLAAMLLAGCRTGPPPEAPAPPPAPVPMAEAPADHDVMREIRALRKAIAEKRAAAAGLLREAHEALDRGEYATSEDRHRAGKRAEAEAAGLDAEEEAVVRKTARRLFPDLDHDDIAVREESTRALIELGTPALPILREEGRDLPFEAARRLAHVVRTLEERLSLRQWASEAKASTEYSASNWSAKQATGPPDTDRAGDCQTAWASKDPDGDEEWLEVAFKKAVAPTKIRIHETFNPGAVVKVEGKDAAGKWRTLWEGAAAPGEAPRWFEVPLTETGWETRELRITFDSDAVPGWNEIDAVELVGANPDLKPTR